MAILATYNERRFIGNCIEHLHAQGIDVYVCDDGSTDETMKIAEQHLGRGLIGIEQLPRPEGGTFDLAAQLSRKEELTREIDADWFMHMDADEIRLPPPGQATLADAFAAADRNGFNAVNFVEFTFVPTREEPDHDHPRYLDTLRSYYAFSPRFPHHLKAWSTNDPVDLVSSKGHNVSFPGLRMYPVSFPMKHYLFLSAPHAIEKYVNGREGRRADSWRTHLTESTVDLLSQSELQRADRGVELDASRPRARHYLADRLQTRL